MDIGTQGLCSSPAIPSPTLCLCLSPVSIFTEIFPSEKCMLQQLQRIHSLHRHLQRFVKIWFFSSFAICLHFVIYCCIVWFALCHYTTVVFCRSSTYPHLRVCHSHSRRPDQHSKQHEQPWLITPYIASPNANPAPYSGWKEDCNWVLFQCSWGLGEAPMGINRLESEWPSYSVIR